ncbi:hypothetical protein SIM22_04000 [Bacillus cereus group sp. BfR-BA-01363]|uniref:hypothetical protein n=1 Tax=Bacillus cereus group sp. BfR-BA-01363 TaxID=3094882 RepID=UPI0029C50AF3|nr:hypothetical protein [Bacillus cereus group sp. BfR-BA-01363]MDX5853290.1 hypothetical protein [Bacillus cereus group sp. BfR-BA-01363]
MKKQKRLIDKLMDIPTDFLLTYNGEYGHLLINPVKAEIVDNIDRNKIEENVKDAYLEENKESILEGIELSYQEQKDEGIPRQMYLKQCLKAYTTKWYEYDDVYIYKKNTLYKKILEGLCEGTAFKIQDDRNGLLLFSNSYSAQLLYKGSYVGMIKINDDGTTQIIN